MKLCFSIYHPDQESVGPDNIEGYGQVQALAECLVSLRSQRTPITQATSIITLWNNLNPYDKSSPRLSPRFKTKSRTSRFKKTKTTVAPGVESTKRCFLGQNTGPAQWPDCNRYMEAVILKLCDYYPSPAKTSGVKLTRWTLVGKAYKNIRNLVLNNARVMAETRIQLLEINNTTHCQWYNRLAKRQEREVLEQGITLQHQALTSDQPLPPALTQPESRPSVTESSAFTFTLPPNTVGQAKTRRRQQPLPTPPGQPVKMQPVPLQPVEAVPTGGPFVLVLPPAMPFNNSQYCHVNHPMYCHNNHSQYATSI